MVVPALLGVVRPTGDVVLAPASEGILDGVEAAAAAPLAVEGGATLLACGIPEGGGGGEEGVASPFVFAFATVEAGFGMTGWLAEEGMPVVEGRGRPEGADASDTLRECPAVFAAFAAPAFAALLMLVFLRDPEEDEAGTDTDWLLLCLLLLLLLLPSLASLLFEPRSEGNLRILPELPLLCCRCRLAGRLLLLSSGM